jgi:hypothetical protein
LLNNGVSAMGKKKGEKLQNGGVSVMGEKAKKKI